MTINGHEVNIISSNIPVTMPYVHVCCNQGARSLWEASFPGAVSSHAADPAAPGRGTLPTRWQWWQYLRGSRWPPGTVHPWECKTNNSWQQLCRNHKDISNMDYFVYIGNQYRKCHMLGPLPELRFLFCFNIDIWLCFLQDGTDAVVKDVLPGDSVHSLLSILDIITVRIHPHMSYTCILKQIL